MNEQLTIPSSDTSRVIVKRWDSPSGRSFVAIAPEYRDRHGSWRLAHSAVTILPDQAAALAAAITAVAAAMDGQPVDPEPTEDDRELSRMP
jgi:hypothetical protein